jgi:lipoyl-dependent peroxiredoxin
MATRNGSAEWHGDIRSGSGRVTVGEGTFEGDYSFRSRFEDGEGTNPEELMAASHASCFAMAITSLMAADGHAPESVRSRAHVHLRQIEGAPTIARIDLEAEGTVPGLDDEAFRRYAEQAKAVCPVSRALAGVPEIELTARLA